LPVDAWSKEPGTVIPPYGVPAKYESKVVRTLTNPNNEPRTSNARTPHHLLDGTITPNGLHFVVARAGFPDIDPSKHRLVIHGLVKQPLVFDIEALSRYPKVTRIRFVECGGNSAPLYRPDSGQCAGDPRLAVLFPVDRGCGCRLFSKRPASIRKRSGSSPKAPTDRA
jgi:sulfane dehydrogenase subunit SoxC